jgi:hypothetical protein
MRLGQCRWYQPTSLPMVPQHTSRDSLDISLCVCLLLTPTLPIILVQYLVRKLSILSLTGLIDFRTRLTIAHEVVLLSRSKTGIDFAINVLFRFTNPICCLAIDVLE